MRNDLDILGDDIRILSIMKSPKTITFRVETRKVKQLDAYA